MKYTIFQASSLIYLSFSSGFCSYFFIESGWRTYPPHKRTLHWSSSIFFIFLLIDVMFKKLKIILCASNSPLETFVYSILVMLLIKVYNLISRSSFFSLFSMAVLKSLLTYVNEYWYIGSIPAKSAMTKYKIAPLIATLLY